MARVAAHLSVSELEQGYRVAKEATTARHFQAIWLLAKGHTIPEVSALTSFGSRWLEQVARLLRRPSVGAPEPASQLAVGVPTPRRSVYKMR